MKICIRADGGSFIGLGHIMRTLVIAKALKKKYDVFYVCRNSVDDPAKYEAGVDLVKSNGFDVIVIDETVFRTDICKINADMIITDSYEVDEDYFRILKEYFPISGCFDDENLCSYFDVDFLINQNPYANELKYCVNKNTMLLLGTDYIALREEFNIKSKKINRFINKIMITVGGSDDDNITERIIQNLLPLNKELFVIVGPAFKHDECLKKYKSSKISLCFNAKLSYYMKICDIAISACGTTIFELASTGTPTVGIVVAENQKNAANALDNLGIIKRSTIENLNQKVDSLNYEKRKVMSGKALQLIDGKAVDRILNVLEDMVKQKLD